jgi:hypothetical protein
MTVKIQPLPGFKMVGEDGNAFAIISRFFHCAKRDGWTKKDIDVVIEEAKSDDYNHLLATFAPYVDKYK